MMVKSISCTLVVAACSAGGDGGSDGRDPTIDRFVPTICDTTCPPPPPADCPLPNGDPQQPIELVPVTRNADGDLVDIVDGSHLQLLRPFQGGRVIYVGVRARNLLDGCNVEVNGALRDPANNRVLGLEQRPTVLVTESDTWAVPVEPYIQSLANVPLCPNAAADRDLDGNTWQLELRLEEGARRATVIRTVVLDCFEDGSSFTSCACECDSEYVLGSGACPVDAVDAGAD